MGFKACQETEVPKVTVVFLALKDQRGERDPSDNLGSKELLVQLVGVNGLPGFNGTEGRPGPPGPKGDTGDKGTPTELAVRLVPGKARGRVEVNVEGVWGTVCDDSFDTVDGKVICKMLGYQTAVSTYVASPGSGKIWLDELGCLGIESDIFNCRHSGVGIHNCNHNEDAGVQCV
ncbi:Macrophage receptor MARCO [Liparis tanakae]|uniref:Macrophage receptor MARCO n=1 Tax=Liparis tanakae TaxID=230148 RepID=A0A4Z2GUE7_9TELE|nr:Macrophage receptor MARCO [Liparis tanakae]